MNSFDEFTKRLSLLSKKHPRLMINTLSNVFTMRLLGNKTHGDLAEVAITEFVNQFMYDYKASHVGKDLFRAKSSEEDILVTSLVNKESIPISLKAYGVGPLQLSTDKKAILFPTLEDFKMDVINDPIKIDEILNLDAFNHAINLNVLPLIYNEKEQECAIMIFSHDSLRSTATIRKVSSNNRGRIHPIWLFEDSDGEYICEVRYGGRNANALQRGLWTHTSRAAKHFKFITDGWISYSHNLTLVELFAKALNTPEEGHKNALLTIEESLRKLKEAEGLP